MTYFKRRRSYNTKIKGGGRKRSLKKQRNKEGKKKTKRNKEKKKKKKKEERRKKKEMDKKIAPSMDRQIDTYNFPHMLIWQQTKALSVRTIYKNKEADSTLASI